MEPNYRSTSKADTVNGDKDPTGNQTTHISRVEDSVGLALPGEPPAPSPAASNQVINRAYEPVR